ncbi:MAG: PDDEXK nuclease domain-containing protein [archaeon]
MKNKISKSNLENNNSISSKDNIYLNIKTILEEARNKAWRAVNFEMVTAYWNIGKVIVEEEQKGQKRAEYGAKLIKFLSEKLTNDFGKGYTVNNLWYMKQFYNTYQNLHALRGELSWTHYRLLLHVENQDARSFYEIETVNNKWSTRELDRQICSLLFERLVLSNKGATAKELASKGQVIEEPKDLIKDPYVLEFLELKENKNVLEKDLEDILITKLKHFILELGKGFSFVERQKRISVDGDHYYVDLVFYNYILKCFFLIDLKTKKLSHEDIGQMDFYVRYFEAEIKGKDDNSTIGLILCSEKNKAMVKYTLLSDPKNNQIFASKYKSVLPSKEELEKQLVTEREKLEIENKFKFEQNHI